MLQRCGTKSAKRHLRRLRGRQRRFRRNCDHVLSKQIVRSVTPGDGIAVCCYEVGAPVAEAMEGRAWWPLASRPTGPGRWHLNLREAVRRELAECGVAGHQVETVPDCTKCRPDLFYSYRRDGVTGRMAACIRLSE